MVIDQRYPPFSKSCTTVEDHARLQVTHLLGPRKEVDGFNGSLNNEIPLLFDVHVQSIKHYIKNNK